MILNYFPNRVLIVGGTGFTGERAALRLRRLGVTVRVLTRHPESPSARRLHLHGCEVQEGDCSRRWTLWQALDGSDVLVSCAHIRHAPVLVQACLRTGVRRLICLSSTRRYSKVECPSVGEVIAGEAAVRDSELEWTILRETMIFGGDRDRNISRILRWVRRRPLVPMFGDGKSLIQPVFVEDVVTGIVEALRRPAAIGKEYHLAGPKAMTYDEMIRAIAEACDREIRIVHIPIGLGVAGVRLLRPVARRYGLGEAALLRLAENKDFDPGEARGELGVEPTPFAEALGMMVARTSEVDVLYVPVS